MRRSRVIVAWSIMILGFMAGHFLGPRMDGRGWWLQVFSIGIGIWIFLRDPGDKDK